jgi:hypothetical protein
MMAVMVRPLSGHGVDSRAAGSEAGGRDRRAGGADGQRFDLGLDLLSGGWHLGEGG